MVTASNTVFEYHLSRLRALERWRESAIRPGADVCCEEDRDSLQREDDDCAELGRRCGIARQRMYENLPPNEQALDRHLVARPSGIPDAGFGLFFEPTTDEVAPKDTILCYYSGHIHNFQSTPGLRDKRYLMLVADDILVDPGPLPHIKARFINDALNEEFDNCKYVPQARFFRSAVVATRDIRPGEELFAPYGDAYWMQQLSQGRRIGSRTYP